jgi:hypothetical protein
MGTTTTIELSMEQLQGVFTTLMLGLVFCYLIYLATRNTLGWIKGRLVQTWLQQQQRAGSAADQFADDDDNDDEGDTRPVPTEHVRRRK